MGRYLGQSDPGLNKTGELQARAAADLLMGEKIDRVFSSDLLRAVETSRFIARVHNLPIRFMSSLREMNFGFWDGLTFEEIQTRYPGQVDEWLKDPFGVRIPGGETAEEVWCRVMKAWNEIILQVSGEETVVIVAHGGPLRMLMCQLMGIDSSRQWEFNLGHGESFVLLKNDETYIDKKVGEK